MKRFSLSRVFGKAHVAMATRQLNRPIFRRQRGASAIEYVIIAAIIAIGIALAAGPVSEQISTLFGNIESEVKSVNDEVTASEDT